MLIKYVLIKQVQFVIVEVPQIQYIDRLVMCEDLRPLVTSPPPAVPGEDHGLHPQAVVRRWRPRGLRGGGQGGRRTVPRAVQVDLEPGTMDQFDEVMVEKQVMVPQVEVHERIVEMPQCIIQERIVEVPQLCQTEVVRQVPKIEYQETVKQLPKPVNEMNTKKYDVGELKDLLSNNKGEVNHIRRIVLACERDMEDFTAAMDAVNVDLDEMRARVDATHSIITSRQRVEATMTAEISTMRLDIGDIQEALKNHDSWMEDVSNALQQKQEEDEKKVLEFTNTYRKETLSLVEELVNHLVEQAKDDTKREHDLTAHLQEDLKELGDEPALDDDETAEFDWSKLMSGMFSDPVTKMVDEVMTRWRAEKASVSAMQQNPPCTLR